MTKGGVDKKGQTTSSAVSVSMGIRASSTRRRFLWFVLYRGFLSTFGDVLRDSVYKVIYKGETPLAT